MRNFLNKYHLPLVFFLYFVAANLFIHPGEYPFWERSQNFVLSNDTDSVVLPYQFSVILEFWKKFPSELFYGSIFVPYVDAPVGSNFWFVPIDRLQTLIYSFFFPVEQISTAIVIVSMTLNGFFFYLLGRALNWKKRIGFILGWAWAFSAFTRARAVVHVGFVGIYHLPMVFLGIILVFQKKDRRSLYLAGFLFFLVGLMPPYFLITLCFLSPFFLYFAYWASDNIKDFFSSLPKLLIVLLPTIICLSHFLINPVSPRTPQEVSAFPDYGRPPPGYPYHPFLDWYASSPLDYFSGDIGIGAKDINPLREILNGAILSDLGRSNAHEHANGIRWCLWGLAIFSLISLLPIKKLSSYFLWSHQEKNILILLGIFAFFCFLLSLPPFPDYPYLSPSLWLHRIVSQIRVTSRAGIGVHFAILLMSGVFLQKFFVQVKLLFPIVATLILLELLPFVQDMPVSKILPVYEPLKKISTDCGLGMPYPYYSAQHDIFSFYYLLPQIRGTQCSILSHSHPYRVDKALIINFGLTAQHLRHLENGGSGIVDRFVKFAKCVPLNWVILHQSLSNSVKENICSRLDGKLAEQGICLLPRGDGPLKIPTSVPASCLDF